jgi:hypothetical protein
LYGTDTLDNGGTVRTATPPYWSGFYVFANDEWRFAVGNHYVVIEGFRQ